jgi:hypothetical protein
LFGARSTPDLGSTPFSLLQRSVLEFCGSDWFARCILLCADNELQIVTVIQSSIVLGACSDGLGKSIELVPLGIQDKIQQVRKNCFGPVRGFPSINRPSTDVLCQHSALCHSSRLVQDVGRLLPSAFDRDQTPQASLQRGSSTRSRVDGWINFCCCAAMQSRSPMDHCRRTLRRNGITPYRPNQFDDNGWLTFMIVQFLRWQIICAFDIVSEVGLVGMAICLIWGLRTPKSRKAVVVGAFGFRLL